MHTLLNQMNKLDAGCGTGAMLGMFRKDCPDKNYTGTDFSEKMIETAKKKKLDGVCFVAGDCENLHFEENSFDVAICSMRFHHYPPPKNSSKACTESCAKETSMFICYN